MQKARLIILSATVLVVSTCAVHLATNNSGTDRDQDLPEGFFPHPFDFEARSSGEKQWSILAVGDIMAPSVVQLAAAAHKDDPGETSGGYDWIFQEGFELFSKPDVTVGNLEFPVSASAPRFSKGHNGPPEYLDALKKSGFDIVFTANNHALDQGVKGSMDTIDELNKRGIMNLGTSAVGEKRREVLIAPVGKKEDKFKVAFLNYTEGLNDYSDMTILRYLFEGRNINYALFRKDERLAKRLFGALAQQLLPGSMIGTQEVFLRTVAQNIEAARRAQAEYVVVFLHWGLAGHRMPSREQRNVALRLCNLGADAVIGSGPHVIQPFEVITTENASASDRRGHEGRECLIAYSLGNFVAAHRGARQFGMALEVIIADGGNGKYLQNVRPHIVKSEFDRAQGRCDDGRHEAECPGRIRLTDLSEFRSAE